jgi:hypothetical protein
MSSIREGRLRVKAGLSWCSSSEEKRSKKPPFSPSTVIQAPRSCITQLPMPKVPQLSLPPLYVYEMENSPLTSPRLSLSFPAYASYLRLASLTASYPAVINTIARSDTISEPVPVMRHPRKTMQRFVVSHVKSICCRNQLGMV